MLNWMKSQESRQQRCISIQGQGSSWLQLAKDPHEEARVRKAAKVTYVCRRCCVNVYNVSETVGIRYNTRKLSRSAGNASQECVEFEYWIEIIEDESKCWGEILRFRTSQAREYMPRHVLRPTACCRNKRKRERHKADASQFRVKRPLVWFVSNNLS